jgi:hypothetical protein
MIAGQCVRVSGKPSIIPLCLGGGTLHDSMLFFYDQIPIIDGSPASSMLFLLSGYGHLEISNA